MAIETFIHSLPNGNELKFTINEKMFGAETFYYAYVINTALDEYKTLSDRMKKSTLGIEVTDGKNHTVYYRNPNALKNDIISKYGFERLTGEH